MNFYTANTQACRLSHLEEKVLECFSTLIGKEVPEAKEIILFGSRARGDSDENSDLDIAIILNLPHIDKKMWDEVWDLKWRVLEALQVEEFPLSLSLITLNDLLSRDFGFEKAIKREGIKIWERKN